MAGRGMAPKPADERVRRNVDPIAQRVVELVAAPQPDLPDAVDWPQATREWWAMWGASPLSAEFSANDWSELLDTALLHAAYWGGKLDVAAELRLRSAKFGATPEDRQRLRISIGTPGTGQPGRRASAGREPGTNRRDRLLSVVENVAG